ncbi:MAG: NUDIX domain-containing protein [Candidatus Staskawiczbacteria bacterium]|nr:NUDIX domain-containing protein [Candidatus Staskawiczbacteria bacterium]
METQREVSVLIPYKIKNRQILVFLQKREKDRKVLPGHFAFFGGKLEEGESPEQALEREIKEELCFDLKEYKLLGKYFFGEWSGSVYFLKVGDDFESQIKVMEGEYGKFFSQQEVSDELMIIGEDKSIIKDLYQRLKKEL